MKPETFLPGEYLIVFCHWIPEKESVQLELNAGTFQSKTTPKTQDPAICTVSLPSGVDIYI